MSSSTSLAFADELATSFLASSGLADDFSFDWADDFEVSSASFFGETKDFVVAFSSLEDDFEVSLDLVSSGGILDPVLSPFDLEVDGSVFDRSVLVGEFILSMVQVLADAMLGCGELWFSSLSAIERQFYMKNYM